MTIAKTIAFKRIMAAIENKEQYDWAVKRVEELLPLVDDNTPTNAPNSIELENCCPIWLLTIQISIMQ